MAELTHNAFVNFTTAVVIDVETTGLDPNEDRVICVAAIKLDLAEAARTGQINATTYRALVSPERPISADATAVHGITDEAVRGKESFAQIAQGLRDFIGDAPIIGHNVQFDKRFLNAEFRRAKVKGLGRTRSYCTMRRVAEHYGFRGAGFRKVSLEHAASLFKIPGRKAQHHDAMEDAQITLQIAAGLYQVDNGLGGSTPAAEPASQARWLWLVVGGVTLVLVLVLLLN